MIDLVTFLLNRLADAEQRAAKDLWYVSNATREGQWQASAGHNLPHSYLRAGDIRIATFSSSTDGEEDLHLYDAELACRLAGAARTRAERAFRDVAAKRKIVSEHRSRGHLHCDTLRYLGTVDNDHPDYRQEWAP